MKKLSIFLIICTILSLLLAACKPVVNTTTTEVEDKTGGTVSVGETEVETEAETEAVKDTIVIANTSGEPGNLHPYNTISVAAFLVASAIVEPLVVLDTQGNPKAALAESWEVEELSITFHLRQGVKFHNGDEFKASDVAFSIEELILNSFGGMAANFDVVDVENIEVVDDYTLVVNQTAPNASLLSLFSNLYIVSQKAYEEMGDDFQFDPVGTGPYTLEEWVVGDHFTLERFDDYWGGAARTKTVIVRNIAEQSQAMIELETGGVDIVNKPAGTDVKRVLNGEVEGIVGLTEETLKTRNNNININFNSEPMANILVRKAIAHLIDREAWTPIISPAVGESSYSMIPQGIWGFDPAIKENYPYDVNVEKAKELMIEAGYPDGFDAILLTDGRDYHQSLAQLLQNVLLEIGINLEIQTMELAQQKEIMVTGEGFDLYLLDCVGNAGDPLSALWRDVHPKFAGVNSTHHHFYTVNNDQGQKFADLLEEIRVTVDPVERQDLMTELQWVFTEDVVYIPVNSIQGFVLALDNVSGYSFRTDSIQIDNELCIVED